MCNATVQPPTYQTCNTHACDAKFFWYAGPWRDVSFNSKRRKRKNTDEDSPFYAAFAFFCSVRKVAAIEGDKCAKSFVCGRTVERRKEFVAVI